MKTRKKFTFPVFILLFAFLLSGCATRYQAQGWTGGYTEVQLTPDSFHICFYGNGYTSPQKVTKYVLLRASELTLEKGFKYFIVTSIEDHTSFQNYSQTNSNSTGSANTYCYSNSTNTQLNHSTVTSTSSGTIRKPAQCITIKCFQTKPQSSSGEVFDAQFYWDTNKET